MIRLLGATIRLLLATFKRFEFGVHVREARARVFGVRDGVRSRRFESLRVRRQPRHLRRRSFQFGRRAPHPNLALSLALGD